MAPAQEERLWRVLKGLEDGLKDLNESRTRDLKRSLELEEKVDEHEEAIREMKESTLAARQTNFEVKTLASQVAALNATVMEAMGVITQSAQQSMMRTVKSARTEAEQDLRILEIEAQLRHTGAAAGKKAGLTWGGGAAVIGTILGVIANYLIEHALK